MLCPGSQLLHVLLPLLPQPSPWLTPSAFRAARSYFGEALPEVSLPGMDSEAKISLEEIF